MLTNGFSRLAAVLLASLSVGTFASAADGPSSVLGVCRSGLGTKSVKVAVRDSKGQIRPESMPGIAVLKTTAWSPNDAERDGACEFEVLLSVARLLQNHALAGVVGLGDRNGHFLPAAEQALTRSVLMGVPVVKVASSGHTRLDTDNLYVESRGLSTEQSQALLSRCLLTLGALPPVANPLAPTEGEIAVIKEKVSRYQVVFDAEAGADTRVAAR